MTPEQLTTRIVAWLGVKADSADADHAAAVAPAVLDWVDAMPSIRRTPEGAWTAGTELGAVMLGARLTRRRNSPNGIEAFSTEGSAYVQREDPDVAKLLRLGKYKPPQVG